MPDKATKVGGIVIGFVGLVLMLLFGTVCSFAISSLLKKRATARLQAERESPACVACGANEVQRDDTHARCAACGYEGRADGGGDLNARDLKGLYAGTNHFGDTLNMISQGLKERS